MDILWQAEIEIRQGGAWRPVESVEEASAAAQAFGFELEGMGEPWMLRLLHWTDRCDEIEDTIGLGRDWVRADGDYRIRVSQS